MSLCNTIFSWLLECFQFVRSVIVSYCSGDPALTLEGGGLRHSRRVPFALVREGTCTNGTLNGLYDGDFLEYIGYAVSPPLCNPTEVFMTVCLEMLVSRLPLVELPKLAALHGIRYPRPHKPELLRLSVAGHVCDGRCILYVSHFRRPLFSAVNPFGRDTFAPSQVVEPPPAYIFPSSPSFPPLPLSSRTLVEIIRGWTADISSGALDDAPCAVCGELTIKRDMITRSLDDPLLGRLIRLDATVAVLPTSSALHPPQAVRGPILEPAGVFSLDSVMVAGICSGCDTHLRKHNLPPRSLANGTWVGAVPAPLRDLNYAEKLCIARKRHNVFAVCVTMGQRRMRANCIAFPQPVAEFYSVLPPRPEELNSCLAVMFTGPHAPTVDDLARTPLLVRKTAVLEALEWLKLNHTDYYDVDISLDNLSLYPDQTLPVSYMYRVSVPNDGSSGVESLAVFDDGEEKGTDHGPCSFAVHAVSAETLPGLSTQAKVAAVLLHMQRGGSILAYGHGSEPETIYRNPSLFPSMFPWLFPYGLGGFENTTIRSRLGRPSHVSHYLLYHDRRFQTDEYFSFVIFSHDQVRGSALGGYLLTEKTNFPDVARKLLTLNMDTLDALVARGKKDGFVVHTNDEEKRCFEVLHYIDHVSAHVPNSVVHKRSQKNEIISLSYHTGTPSFLVTFSPADIKNPLCLHYAGEDIDLTAACPNMPDASARVRAIARNPVAGARFFHLMVTLFVKHILRWDTGTDGLFGPTAAYYGTVESQGRLTLHMHALIWTKCSLSPQQVRDRALASTEFQSALTAWLESCCDSGLSCGTVDSANEARAQAVAPLPDPTLELPLPPPALDCSQEEFDNYLRIVNETIDLLILRNQVHRCGLHCLRDGSCRARFPRLCIVRSFFDELGAFQLKQSEQMVNTFTRLMLYLLRCNSDTTCLLSGTRVRAIIAYITDYITKSQLKTYTLFETIRSVFDKNSELVADADDSGLLARRLVTKIVNALNAKTETGGPMLCASLLGHPDHYTSHTFVRFYWHNYVRLVAHHIGLDLQVDGERTSPDKVQVSLGRGGFVAHSKMNDYLFRPAELEHWSLYDFVRRTTVVRLPIAVPTAPAGDGESDDDDYSRGERPQYDQIAVEEEPDEIDVSLSKSCLRFLPGHPKFATHAVSVTDDYDLIVVDFLGKKLPRRSPDGPSSDIYYVTMLTLFTPCGWRSGHDMVVQDTAWEHVFASTAFSAHSSFVMGNFNVLYECTDDRDDFSAQRRRDKQDAAPLGIFAGSELNALDIESAQDEVVSDAASDDALCLLPLEYEGHAAHIHAEMDVIQQYMCYLVSRQATPFQLRSLPLASGDLPAMSSPQWNACLKDEKESLILARRNMQASVDSPLVMGNASRLITEGGVCIITPSTCGGDVHSYYLDNPPSSLFSRDDVTPLMRDMCAHFTLNAEQVRAFVTIAHSLTRPCTEPLLMYLGGMGGTGKSQVIKSLTTFFACRGERGRLMLLAPTGAAACLIGGSTYHSVLRLARGGTPSEKTLDEVRTALTGVNLLFIDEVSMLSTSDIGRISKRLSAVFGCDQPFGGLHMVLAGDFCQLPPASPGSTSLYSRTVSLGISNQAINSALGRTIWHQVLNVTILRENMRQRGISVQDGQLRDALIRLRLRQCTDADVALFRSRVTMRYAGAPAVTDVPFRYVSIITAWNSHRDAINSLLAPRFAKDAHQVLVPFFSRDTVVGNTGGLHMDAKLQDLLWDAPPCMLSQYLPGCLPLCRGMPVMIKYNVATELSITNGAEGTVVAWSAHVTPSGKQVLEVLYVLLTNPAMDVQLPHLPPNVVPITPRTETVDVEMRNSKSLKVRRTQVPLMLNFAMTDYCSQGWTRPFNPVDLRNCRNHQSAYTCLSRGSSLEGILILQEFDDSKMKGGLSGDLRNELLELELLDDISALRYRNDLKRSVNGCTRRDLLRSFRAAYRSEYVPVHNSQLGSTLAPTKRSLPSHSYQHLGTTKRRRVLPPPTSRSPQQEGDLQQAVGLPQEGGLTKLGLRWDATNYSCAYDSIFTVLLNSLSDFPSMWDSVRSHNPILNLFLRFSSQYGQSATVSSLSAAESARNDVRDVLCSTNGLHFPRLGPVLTDIGNVLHALFSREKAFAHHTYYCDHCSWTGESGGSVKNILWSTQAVLRDLTAPITTVADLFSHFLAPPTHYDCPMCDQRTLHDRLLCTELPSVLVMILPPQHNIDVTIDHDFEMPIAHGSTRWYLQSMIYLGSSHFTSRFVCADHSVWYHDGIETGARCRYEASSLHDISDLNVAYGRHVAVVIYRRDNTTTSQCDP